jgi:hypothetical protein
LIVCCTQPQILGTEANELTADTHLLKDYFTEIRRIHLTHPSSSLALYVCPIVFDRNSNDSPIFVRTADLLWSWAGLSGFYPWAPVHIPTSVYSLPLNLAEEVNGWDGDPTAIGEDMHMLLKVYFNTRGRVVTIPLYSPASQCNVSSAEAGGWRKTMDTLRARWRQATRHMWGSLDSGYAVRRLTQTRLLRVSNIPLMHLLWEAHVLPTHFILTLIGCGLYSLFTPASATHPQLLMMFSVTNILRNASFIAMQLTFCLYEPFHRLCVEQRGKDMTRAGIPHTLSIRHPWHLRFLFERICFPITGVLYGALPALYAQFSHFFTDRLVYQVSVKPKDRDLDVV